MIKPEIGMPVLYFPGQDGGAMKRIGDNPLAATITMVWSDSCVNLSVTDAHNRVWGTTSVLLVQGQSDPSHDMIAAVGRYCEFPVWLQALVKSASAPREDYFPAPMLGRLQPLLEEPGAVEVSR